MQKKILEKLLFDREQEICIKCYCNLQDSKIKEMQDKDSIIIELRKILIK